ncbi:MAG: cohesin domain-containing protein [bacterium]
MLNLRFFTRYLAVAMVVLIFSGISVAQVTVSMPNITGTLGAVTIPVTVGDLTGKGVISYDLSISYDPTIVTITDVDKIGTVSAGMTIQKNISGGVVKIAAAQIDPLASTGGTLINLKGTLIAKGTSPLTFTTMVFNDGTPSAATTDGSVSAPTFAINVQTTVVTSVVGGKFNIPIKTEDVTGKAIVSYELALTYDPAKIKITGVSKTGTMSANFSVQANTATSGTVKIAGAGADALTGTGTLIDLVAEIVAGGTSDVKFTSVKFNEGTPTGAGIDGTVTVAINNKPVFVNKLADKTVNENEAVSFTYTATDPEGTPLTFSLVGGPTGAAVTTAGVFTWTPTYEQGSATPYNINVVVSDGQLTDTAKAKITVTNVNRKPVKSAQVPATAPTAISRNVPFSFSVTVSDPDGDAVTYVWTVNGVVQSSTTNAFSYIPTQTHGTAFVFRVVFSDAGGLKDSVSWSTTVTPVSDVEVIPTEFALNQNYPNPFNPTTNLNFELPKEAPVTLEIYNVLGVKVRTLIAGTAMNAGRYTMKWDGKNEAGASVTTGIYIARFNAGGFQASMKMTLMK